MAGPMISLSLQLATVLIPEVGALLRAIAALRNKGVDPAAVAAMVQSISDNISTLDANTLEVLSAIPPPAPK